MKKRLPTCYRRGDTLVEISIALAILSLLVAVAMTGALRAYRVANLARERTVAFNIAQSQADALRLYKEGYDWDTFTNPTHLGNIITCWGTQFCGYPPDTLGGIIPNDFNIAKITTSAGLTPTSSHSFVMVASGSPNRWTVDPNHGALIQPDTGNTYYVVIVPNRGNPSNDASGCQLSNNLIRFDVIVRWKSAIGGTTSPENISSLVVYLSRSQGSFAIATKIGCP